MNYEGIVIQEPKSSESELLDVALGQVSDCLDKFGRALAANPARSAHPRDDDMDRSVARFNLRDAVQVMRALIQ